MGYEFINLGGHEVITINELISILEGMIGKEAEIERYPQHPADAMTNQADVSKARQLLGWEPEVSLKEGIKQMVDWYDDNRDLAKQINTK